MKYKKIITSGCSFSSNETPYTWPLQLESYIQKNIDENVKFDHRGLSSQGQELISKKTAHAIYEALSMGYKPDDIAVFVMWSSVDRKSFYIDNPDTIKEIVQNWRGSKQGWALQLSDLKNSRTKLELCRSKAEGNNMIYYHTDGGWYITSAHVLDELKFVRDYFMTGLNPISFSLIHDSLQCITYLQHLCKSKGIKLYQQFYMENIMRDIDTARGHQIIDYLADDIDWSTFISKKSIHGYLEHDQNCFVGTGNSHPNGLGHRIWLNEVILPHLEQDGFFED